MHSSPFEGDGQSRGEEHHPSSQPASPKGTAPQQLGYNGTQNSLNDNPKALDAYAKGLEGKNYIRY